jgi:protoporphyrinogen/coproporphyrinogen III oxidase
VSGRPRPTVAVVGGGIAGLSAAWELTGGPVGPVDAGTPEVHVFEADDRPGGKLRAAPFAGRTVDLAADAFLTRRPEATELCRELGLTDELVDVGASGASIWARGRLRAMPDKLVLGVPTRWWPLARSGILGPLESLEVTRDFLLPHFGTGVVAGDRSIGEIVGERLGRPIVDRLVDPLIGGINAGGVDELSAAATFPHLIAVAHQPGSLMHQLGRTRTTTETGDGTPVFRSLAGSTASLTDALTGALEERGVAVHTSTPVDAIEGTRSGRVGRGRWRLTLGETGVLSVDGLVLAVPAPRAAVLLVPHAPVAAGLLSTIEYASVAVVTLSFPSAAIPQTLHGTGFLVPRTALIDEQPALITAATYLGRKWAHLARPGEELIRVSAGRWGDERHRELDDDELRASVLGDLATVLGVRQPPTEALVTRWDDAFPQYRPGHLIRVGKIEEDVAALPGVAVAGAALRGVGIPACVESGRSAAQRVLSSLRSGSEPSGRRGVDLR